MSSNTETPKRKQDKSSALKSPPWLLWAFAAAIVGASFLAYGAGLDNGFTNWDDNWLITENPHIRAITWENFQYWFNPLAPREDLGNEYLPVRDLSYAVNYALDGYDPRAWHATNLIIHVFNSLLVMLFAARLTGRRWIGGAAGLLFALHPVHVEAVSWLSSRKDVLATLFLMLSANLYLAARRPKSTGGADESFIRRAKESTRLVYVLAIFCFVLALLSKMTAVVLPALLLLVELFRGRRLGALSVPRRALVQAPFWGIALLFTALASHIGTGLMREPYGDGRVQSLLTALSAVTRDFQVMIAGYPTYAAVDLPVQTGLSLTVGVGLLIVLLLIAAGVAGWARAGDWDSRGRLALGVCGFSALWFLAALAPVSNFAVQIGTVFAERYLYIPSIGFCIAVAALLILGIEQARTRPTLRLSLAPALGVAALGVLGLYTWATMEAVRPWSGSTSLWSHTLRHDPGNHIAHFNLGRVYQEKALLEPDEARREELFVRADTHFKAALDNEARTYRHDPARVYAAMALNHIHRDEPARALELLESARGHIDLPWRDAEARMDVEALLANPRGLAYSRLGEHEKAVAAFEETIAKSDRYPGARVNLASELVRVGLTGEIDEDKLARAKKLLNDYERRWGRTAQLVEARARNTLKEFEARLEHSGRGGEQDVPEDLKPLLDESRKLFRELVALREQGATPDTAMVATLIEAADAFGRGTAADKTAEEYLRRALKLKPDYVGLRYLLAQVLFERGGVARAEATRLLNDELDRNPDYQPALALKAAGLRQNFVNELGRIKGQWKEEYAAVKGDPDPTYEALITEFFTRKAFRDQLNLAVKLLRDAIETDPANEESHGLVSDVGISLALSMWFTQDKELRMKAEDLMRVAFNARPEDGPVAGLLTTFYLDLAEALMFRPNEEISEEQRREDVNDLITRMLQLSERARRILSNKLFKSGMRIETGELQMKNDEGNPMELSEGARRMSASELIRAAAMLNPENIEALDWLKSYYEDTGKFEEALAAFEKLITALEDRPELMHGVHLSLAQLQLDFGESLVKSFRHRLKLGMDAEAAELRDKAVATYLEALGTTGKLIDEGTNPEKMNLPIRLRGVVAQRLAYLDTSRAGRYYTVALDAYALAPLDFADEIKEVRRKRVWFVRDPYERLRQLKRIVEDATPEQDIAGVQDDIINLQRRIAREEARDMLEEGRFEAALERLDEAMNAPTPELFAIRGRVYMELSERAEGEERDALLAKGVKDLERGLTDPDALIRAGVSLWEDEALMFEDNRVARARTALTRAETIIETALPGMKDDSDARERYLKLLEEVNGKLKEMRTLAARYLHGARAEFERGELESALSLADRAVVLLGDHAPAYQLQGRILMALASRGGEDAEALGVEARNAFTTALRMDNLLTSQRLSLMDDMTRLQLDVLRDRRTGADWLDRYRRAVDDAGEELRAIYRPRVDELKRKLNE